MKLTDVAARKAKPQNNDYKMSDAGGLHLLIRKNGSKLWRYRYRFAGKERTLAIGAYPLISLKEARNKRDDARRMIDEGRDPSLEKQIKKQLHLTKYKNNFEAVGREWFEVRLSGKSESHQSRSLRMLEKELFPYLGIRPIADITAPELLIILRRIEKRGVVDTAHRAKQTAGQVFQYAIQTGRMNRNPATDLTGALRPKETTHYPALTTPKDVGKLMLAMDAYTGSTVVRAALKLSPLFFLRPGELRQLEWSFINWEENRIDVPASLMKMKDAHIVPLSRQARKILEQLHGYTGNGKYLFPSQRGQSRPLSENGVRTALRTIGYDNQTMVPHGFRAMARTLLDEVLEYRIEWIEQQLAHTVKDANGRAYNRTKHLAQRTEMMQRWADYLDELKQAAVDENVVIAKFR